MRYCPLYYNNIRPHRGIDGPALWSMSLSMAIICFSLDNHMQFSGLFDASFAYRYVNTVFFSNNFKKYGTIETFY